MNTDLFVLTGGPGGGKTTAMAYLQQKLGDVGRHLITVPEAATMLINNGITPDIVGIEEFQRWVIRRITSLEDDAIAFAKTIPEKNPIIIGDRGIQDSRAYVSEDIYKQALLDVGFSGIPEVRDERYKSVFHLVTAANGAEKFYTLKNNAARSESPHKARIMDMRTMDAWVGCPHLRVIDNSRGTFEAKLDYLWSCLCHELGMPIPLEIERKYLLRKFDPSQIPVHYQEIDIEQVYLTNGTRLRKRGQDGTSVYFETRKTPIDSTTQLEEEEIIEERDYERAMQFQDQKREVVRKKRYCFIWESQYFELDVFEDFEHPLLEIELTKATSKVVLPPFLDIVREVTEEKKFSNFSIAEQLSKTAA